MYDGLNHRLRGKGEAERPCSRNGNGGRDQDMAERSS
jgi:hypothetical protein